jgi:hypothetical protein
MTPYLDDEVLPIPHSQVYRFRVNASRKVRLEKVFCDAREPGDAIAVTVNGQIYDPVWLLDESGINYAAQLVPRTPLAITRCQSVKYAAELFSRNFRVGVLPLM